LSSLGRRVCATAAQGRTTSIGLLLCFLTGATTAAGTLDEVRSLVQKARYAEAEQRARCILAQAENPLAAARALDVVAESLWRAGHAREAVPLAERALAIRERERGPDHPETAQALHDLANVWEFLADARKARPLYERAVAIRKQTLGPDHPDVAVTLTKLGWLAWRLEGSALRARPPIDRALAIQERTLDPEHLDLATTLTALASLRFGGFGERVEAGENYQRALAIRERALGPDHPDVAETAALYGSYLRRGSRDHRRARELIERALDIRERVLGRRHPHFAFSLMTLRSLEAESDGATRAELAERTLATYEQTLGPDNVYVARALQARAASEKEWPEKWRYLARARDIFERATDSGHYILAYVMSGLAERALEVGDPAEAWRYCDRAIAIVEATLGPHAPLRVYVLSTRSWQHARRGDYAKAIAARERVVRSWEHVYGKDSFTVASSLYGLALMRHPAGDLAGARADLERAIRIREPFGARDWLTATYQVELANVLRDGGDLEQARPLYEGALALHEELHGPDCPDVDFRLVSYARLLYLAGERERAATVALEAEAMRRRQREVLVRALPERQALGYAAEGRWGLNLALTLAVETRPEKAPIEEAWDALVRGRAVVLDGVAARHRAALDTGDLEVRQLANALDAARGRLADLYVRGARRRTADEFRRLVNAARQEREEAERALAYRSVAFQLEHSWSSTGLDDVVQSLPSGSALVAYARYEHEPAWPSLPDDVPTDRPVRPEVVPSYLAFVHVAPPLAGNAGRPSVIRLGEAREIEELVSRWRAEAASGTAQTGRSSSATERAYRDAGAALRTAVWDPLRARLDGVERVFVVPDGSLQLVGFGSLPSAKGTYLLETGPLIHYLSAERDLVRPGFEQVSASGGLLAMGGPAFDSKRPFTSPGADGREAPVPRFASLQPYRGQRSACRGFRDLSFSPLPASALEVEEVATLWRDHEGVASATDVFLGAEASEARFKAEAPGRRVLHLATHGFFLGDGDACPSAMSAARGIGGANPLNHSRRPSPTHVENPLLQAGLALAGANHRDAATADEEDGILTAEEVAALDLSGVEWAVLSACDTGSGRIEAGEGVIGLRRSFQIAGVHTVVMSLWSIKDDLARSWMRSLYEARLERGLSTAEAVQAASLAALAARRAEGQSTHPFYWAGFVAVGDWR